MGANCAISPSSEFHGSPSKTCVARDHECDFLRSQERLCLAWLAARLSCLEDGLSLLSSLAQDGCVGATQTTGAVESRAPQASAMIADSQSAKSAEGGENRGYDGGKHVSGRKRNLLVDTLGLLVLAKVTAANVQDVHAGKQLFSVLAQKPELLVRLEKIFADGGYRGELVDWVQKNLHVVLEIVLKLAEQKGFQVLPKRWVIERTFAWITRNRRLARDYERLAQSSEAFIYVAMIRLGLRRLARP